jgi:SAM-dependent MidA family methyltransferase
VVFANSLATTLAAELAAVDGAAVLELGAGNGTLAAQLLDAFARMGLAVQYEILEPSADFRERQRRSLARFGERVRWLEQLPETPFAGVVIANEVLDALPVARFVKQRGEPFALGVVRDSEGFRWGDGRVVPELATAVAALEAKLQRALPDGYCSEVCLALPAWIRTLAASLERGTLLFVDYGLVRTDYYHEQRANGTLICHYRHRAHDDPFAYPGLQDITAWVDFSACADAAIAAGLDVAGFTTQGQYLMNVLAGMPSAFALELASPREQSALKTLVLPGEMGERFKLLLLRKGNTGPALPGRDFRHRL